MPAAHECWEDKQQDWGEGASAGAGSCPGKAVEGSQALSLLTEVSGGRAWAVWLPGENLIQVDGLQTARLCSVGPRTRNAACLAFPFLPALLWEYF